MTINYVSYTIRPGKVKITASSTDVIRKLQGPLAQTKIRSFLESSIVFGRFVGNFSRVAAPLSKKFFKDSPKSFPSLTIKGKKAVERLEDVLTNLPVPRLPRWELFIL